jgi:hypothetical protein
MARHFHAPNPAKYTYTTQYYQIPNLSVIVSSSFSKPATPKVRTGAGVKPRDGCVRASVRPCPAAAARSSSLDRLAARDARYGMVLPLRVADHDGSIL